MLRIEIAIVDRKEIVEVDRKLHRHRHQQEEVQEEVRIDLYERATLVSVEQERMRKLGKCTG